MQKRLLKFPLPDCEQSETVHGYEDIRLYERREETAGAQGAGKPEAPDAA